MALILMLTVALLSVSNVAASEHTATPFCEHLVHDLARCAHPQGDSHVDMKAFSGKWFEVGITAQRAFASNNLLGGQCAMDTYSYDQNLTVVRQQLQVVTDGQRALVMTLSETARAVFIQITNLCQILVGPGLSMRTFYHAIGRSGNSQEKHLRAPIQSLQRRIATASSNARIIYKSLQTIQELNGQLNGASVPKVPDFGHTQRKIQGEAHKILSVISKMRHGRLRTQLAAKSIIRGSKNSVTKVAADVIKNLASSGGPWHSAIEAMNSATQALDLVAAHIDTEGIKALRSEAKDYVKVPPTLAERVVKQARRFRKAREMVHIAAVLAANSTIKRTAPRVARFLQNIAETIAQGTQHLEDTKNYGGDTIIAEHMALGRIYTTTTIASFNSAQGMWKVSSGVTGSGQAFTVLFAKGNSKTGYSTALISTCTNDASTGNVAENGLVLLSRTPNVNQRLIDRALAAAARHGVFVGGDNPFIATSQNQDFCPQY